MTTVESKAGPTADTVRDEVDAAGFPDANEAEVRELQRQADKIEDTVQVDLPDASPRRIVIDVSAIGVLKIIGILFGLYLLVQIWPLITLFMVSAMLAAALSPYLALLERYGFSRAWSLTVVALSLVILFGFLIALVVPGLVLQTRDLIAHSDAYVASLQALLAQHGIHADLVRNWKSLPKHLSGMNAHLLDAVFAIFDSAVALGTVLFLTLYLLSDQERIKNFVVGLFPAPKRVQVLIIFAELRRQVGGYVRGQMITSALAALFSFIVLVLAGVPNPITLAVYVGIADLIPLFGGMLGMIPCVLIALTISPLRAVIVLLGFVIYQNLENHVIVPRVYGKTLKIPSLVALVGLLIGAKLLGMLGMLIALPITAGLPVILDLAGVHLQVGDRPQVTSDASTDVRE